MTPSDDLPPDLQDVARRLSDERPRPAPGRLDALRGQLFPARSRRAGALGATAVLGLGVLMTGGGAAVAITDLASSPRQTAVQAQYPTTPTTETVPPVEQTQPNQEPPAPAPPPDEPTDEDSDNRGELDEMGSGDKRDEGGSPNLGESAPETQQVAPEQATQQLDSGDGELPFTGYAALPMLGLGALLLLAGAMLRRRLGVPPAA